MIVLFRVCVLVGCYTYVAFDRWLYDPGLLELEVKKSGDPPKITYTLDTFKIQLPRNKVYAHGYGPDTLPAQKTYDTPLPPRVKYVDHTEGCEYSTPSRHVAFFDILQW